MSGNRYAVLIANSKFPKDPGLLQELRCPENDVDGLNDILASPDFGGFTETIVLKNLAHNEILPQLNRVLVRARRDDLILIYYSGHGKLNRKGLLHLATVDTVIDILDATSIPVARMRDLIEISLSERIVLILDCCYSGRIMDVWLKGGIDDQLQREAEYNRGLYILAASTAIQAAQEKEGDQYSFFTKHIIHGIREGEADIHNRGSISVLDLYSYTYEQMRKEKVNSQLPMNWGLNVQGEQLIIAHTGKLNRARWREQARMLLGDLWRQGYLPTKVYTKAIEVSELEVSDLSETQVKYNNLLEQVIQKQLKAGEFIDKWYAIDEWASDEDRRRALLAIISREGQTAIENKDWEAAEASFARAVRLDPLNGHCHVKRGEIFAAQQKWAEAELEFRRAIGLEPSNIEWRKDLDRVLRQQQKWLEATENLLAMVAIEPSNEETAARLQEARRQRRLSTLYAQALNCYDNGDLCSALNHLNDIHGIEENYKDVPAIIKNISEEIRAREAQQKIADLNLAAEEAAGSEEWAAAVEAWEALLALTPGDEKAESNLRYARQQVELASIYDRACEMHNSQRFCEALEEFRKIQEIAPDYKNIDSLVEASESECKRIIEYGQRQTMMTGLYAEAQEAMKAGDWRSASKTLQFLLSQNFDNGERIAELVAFVEGEIVKQDEREKEMAAITNLLDEARASMEKEDWGTAIIKIEGVLNIDPSHKIAIEKLSQAKRQQELSSLYAEGLKLSESGRSQEALDYFHRVQERDNNYKDVAALTANTLGEMKHARVAALYAKAQKAMEQEDWSEAIETLRGILVVDPDHKEAAQALGEARSLQDSATLYAKGKRYYNSGNLPYALKCFQQLSEQNEKYKDVDKLISQIKLGLEESTAYEEKRLKVAALYCEAVKAVEDEKWDAAIDKLQTLLSVDPLHLEAAALYRDALMAAEDEKRDAASDSRQTSPLNPESTVKLRQPEQQDAEKIAALIDAVEDERKQPEEDASKMIAVSEAEEQRKARSIHKLNNLSALMSKFATALRLNRWQMPGSKQGWLAFIQTRTFFYISLAIFILSCTVSLWLLNKNNNLHPRTRHYNQGLEFLAKGDLDLAIQEFSQSLDADRRFADAYYNLGMALMGKGQLDAAKYNFNEILKIDDKYADAYFGLGMANKESDVVSAIENLKVAVMIKIETSDDMLNAKSGIKSYAVPQDVTDLSLSADKHFKDGKDRYGEKQYSQALAEFQQVIQLRSDAARIYINYGAESYKQANYESAQYYFNAASECYAKSSDAYSNRGLVKNKLKMYYEAIEDCTMAINLNPHNTNAYFNRGFASFHQGASKAEEEKKRIKLNEQAIGDFSFVIKSRIENPIDSYVSRGSAHMAKGEYNSAIKDFIDALKLNPQHEAACCNLLTCYHKTNQVPEYKCACRQKSKL